MTLQIHFLGSGSSGNATVLRWEGEAMLVDCGFAPAELERRLRRAGVPLECITALFLTHEHADHRAGLPLFSQRAGLTLHASRPTLQVLRWSSEAPCQAQPLAPGAAVCAGAFRVHAFAVSHDARRPVGYVIEVPDGTRVGLVTDLGCVTKEVVQALTDCDVLGLEANHDRDLLRKGPYPPSLKQRIASRRGHLSNEQAADLLLRVAGERLRHVYALHISEVNNHPELAVRVLSTRLAAHRSSIPVTAVAQDELTHYPPRGQLSLF